MKNGTWSVVLVAVVVSTLAACTVKTSEGSDAEGNAAESPVAVAEDGETSTSASTTPPELVGTSWTWTTSSGAHQLAFANDGRYTSAVFLDAHPGDSCGTEFFTHREGVATFEGTKLTLASTRSTRTKKDSCADEVLADDVIEEDVTAYEWRFADDGEGSRSLVLTSDDGSERTFFRD